MADVLLVLGCLAFVVISIILISHSPSAFDVVVGWVGIAFFGLCGLCILYTTLKERLAGRPFLTITDEAVISNRVIQTVIRFADVESFEVVKMRRQQFIAIHYKPGVERQKMDGTNALGRSIRRLNHRLVNAHDTISTTGTGIKAEALCNLLNDRLVKR